MTGRTHDQLAIPAGLAAGVAMQLPLEQTAAIVLGALTWARGPDYIEPVFHAKHRTWTHWLPTSLLIGLVFAYTSMLLVGPDLGASFGIGVMIGGWMHSLADACTGDVSKNGKPNGGCWLILWRRQWILPLRLRIKVYTVTKQRSWLTGKIKTAKVPSRGDRVYGILGRLATLGFAALYLATVGAAQAHDYFQHPPY